MSGFMDKGNNPADIAGFTYHENRAAHETRVVTLALIACVVASGIGVAVWCLTYQAGWA